MDGSVSNVPTEGASKASVQGEEKTGDTNRTNETNDATSRDARVAADATEQTPADDKISEGNPDAKMGDGSGRNNGQDDNDDASLGTANTDVENRVAPDDTEEEIEARSKTNKEKTYHRSSDMPKYVDEETLKLIKESLKETTEKSQVLDEDEIALRMYKADRNVEQRIKFDSNPIEDIEVDEAVKYRRMYREEEEYLVGHDFLKELQNEAQESRKILDKRTLNWVKRAAGLNKSHLHHSHAKHGHRGDSEDGGGGGAQGNAPRRYTRGMARNTRIKKKEERIFKENLGMKCLLDAIEQLEATHGPYPISVECAKSRNQRLREAERRRETAYNRQLQQQSEASSRRSNQRREPHGGPMSVPLVAIIPTDERDYLRKKFRLKSDSQVFDGVRDVLLTQILVSGIHVEEDDVDGRVIKQRKKDLKRMRDRQYHKRRREEKSMAAQRKKRADATSKFLSPPRNKNKRPPSNVEESDEEADRPRKHNRRRHHSGLLHSGAEPISLRLLHWQRRQALGDPTKKMKIEDEQDVRSRLQVPHALSKAGIGFRLPPWESVKPATAHDPKDKSEPLRRRHSDDLYASWCHNLIDCLYGGARSWATHEFFYSDIDRAWYNENAFARDVAKLGIPPKTRLTRREWSAVRRCIPNRPRRFSKRFIFSQLRERNEYRNQVRQIQRNPDQSNDTGFDIPAPIRVGATVTAFNKKFLIIHRGIVLFHDVFSSRYLVQFERKELGYEYCHDTEVASHGVPEILMSGSANIITCSSTFDVDPKPYGTSYGPTTIVEGKGEVTCQSELASILTGSDPAVVSDKNGGSHNHLVEKVAERETLVTLMSTIDAATSRKTMILDAMEKFNVLSVDRLPFGEGPPSNHVISGYFEKHYAWLRANLELTNSCLETALIHLKVMYSQAYSTTPVHTVLRNENIQRHFVQTVLREGSDSIDCQPFISQPWMETLSGGSREVGKLMAALVCDGNTFTNGNKPTNGENSATTTQPNGFDSAAQLPNVKAGEMQNRVAAAANLLTTVSYFGDRSMESNTIFTARDESPPMLGIALEGCYRDLLETAENASVRESGHLVKEVLDERASAEKELKEALSLLQREFSALDAVNHVQ